MPSFVGSNYFCETGNEGANSLDNFLDDLLWDGKGCPSSNNCCNFNEPPWFYRELPQTTSNTLTLTIELNGRASNENIFIRELNFTFLFEEISNYSTDS